MNNRLILGGVEMNASEIVMVKKEIEKYIEEHGDKLYNMASVKAYVNTKGNPMGQYLKVTINSVYLVEATIDFTIDDFKRLLFYKPETVITDKIVRVLTKLAIGDDLLKDIRKNYEGELTDGQLEYQVSTDKVFLSDVKENLLSR